MATPSPYRDTLADRNFQQTAQPLQAGAFADASGGTFQGGNFRINQFQVRRFQLFPGPDAFRYVRVIEVELQDRFAAGGGKGVDIRDEGHGLFIHRAVDAHVEMLQLFQMGGLDHIRVRQYQLGHDVLRARERQDAADLFRRQGMQAESHPLPDIIQARSAGKDRVTDFRQEGNLLRHFGHGASGVKNHQPTSGAGGPDGLNRFRGHFLPGVEQGAVQVQGNEPVIHPRLPFGIVIAGEVYHTFSRMSTGEEPEKQQHAGATFPFQSGRFHSRIADRKPE